MTTALMSDTTVIARDLDGRGTARVLAQAVEARVQTDVEATGAGFELRCRGVLLRREDPHLVLRLEGGEGTARLIAHSSALRVSMEVAGTRYTFETRPVTCPVEDEPGVIRVLTPGAVRLAERRRSARHRFREPGEVTLYTPDSTTECLCKAGMLNLSRHGLACSAQKDHARSLKIGQVVGAAFVLDPSAPEFRLYGRVTNITQASAAERMVVGLEFVEDDDMDADRHRLEEALG